MSVRPFAPAVVGRGLVLACCLMLGACAATMPARVQPGGHSAVDDRIYFGRAIRGGGSVTDDAWRTFLAEVVTPRFPGGLTWWKGDGQWRNDRDSIIREESFVLELVHDPAGSADTWIDEVIDSYKVRFRQQSVLWVRNNVGVRF